MLAKDIITHEVDALKTSDTGEEAITMMGIFHVKHLPIVNNEVLLGTISEEDIIKNNIYEPIGSYSLSMLSACCNANDHIFEVMNRMAEYDLSAIPVINDKQEFIGCITVSTLLYYFAHSFSFEEPGSLLVIETDRANYSMVEISRIVEEESAAVLSSFLTFEDNSSRVTVTLKINKQDISRIIASFVRYDYTIKGTFTENAYTDALQERYDALMHYLNV
jgi:acetoin utilization protein AcuB